MVRMFDAVEEFLDKIKVKYESITVDERHIAILPGMPGNNSLYTVMIDVDENVPNMAVYCRIDQLFQEDKRLLIAELLTRMNSGLRIGNFEMDMNTGLVLFKVSTVIPNKILSVEIIDAMFVIGLVATDSFFPALMAVIYGGKNPHDAYMEHLTKMGADSMRGQI